MRRYDPSSIKKLRLALKLNQEKFGKPIGMTKQRVYQLESGFKNPNIKTLERIMQAYRVEECFFFVDDITLA